jgi:hypothetical protein
VTEITRHHTQVSWNHLPDDLYIVTGVLVNGQRFRAMVFESWQQADGINLYRGSKWLLRNGKRHLIQRIYN